MTFKGYEYLNKAMKGDLEPRTIIKTEHEKQYFDDRDYDYYIYHNDGMFHRCDKSGKLGAKYQDRFLNYKVLNKDFEMYCVLEDEDKLNLYYNVPNSIEEIDEVLFNTLCSFIENQRKQEDKINELNDKIKELGKTSNITITTVE